VWVVIDKGTTEKQDGDLEEKNPAPQDGADEGK